MRYPIYVPSRGRHQSLERALTARTLLRDGTPFRIVCEADEADAYRELVGADRVLVLPGTGGGSSVYARNWIKDHAASEGHARHWQLDDNIREFRRLYQGRRIPCESGAALAACEDFTDRYANVGIAGLAYQMFVTAQTKAPYFLNVHVYSCMLIDVATPYRFRGRYNEDTDYCLQVLADGRCTVLLNVFMADKMRTMTMGGGNTESLYADDGRLRMAQELERRWPGVVRVTRKFGRPQHTVNWRRFDAPLERRADVDFDALPAVDERGQSLRAVGDVRAPALRRMVGDE